MDRLLRISHIRVHKAFALLLSTIPQIYNKEELKPVEVILIYKFVVDTNKFVFDPVNPKIGHSWFVRDQFSSKYMQSSIPVSMARKDQKHCIKPLFLISQFRK